MKLAGISGFHLLLAGSAWARVKTGLQVLIDSNYTQIDGRKVLILSNPTGITTSLDLGVDVMVESGNIDLVGVMGPEHGFRGTSQNGNGQATFVDVKTGLTVYDAYLANSSTLEGYIRASGADTVLFDIQDVGSRFYTYIWAMYDTMVAAAATNTSFVVLDRPNPITGLNAWGPVLNESYISTYVGRRAIAQVHGMTVGELASLFVGEGWISEAANGSSLALEVIQMEGWNRSMVYYDTKLPWVFPSPNLPSVEAALVYGGTCMFEGTTISEGRGTVLPFLLLGAPWANESWVTAMRELQIPNTNYRFQCFTPTTSKFVNTTACGLEIYLDLQSTQDYASFDPVYLGVSLLYTARHLYTVGNTTTGSPDTHSFHWIYSGSSSTILDVDVLTGSSTIRTGIEMGKTPDEIRHDWLPELQRFREKREKYLLY